MTGPVDTGRAAQMLRRLRSARKPLAAAVALAVAAATLVSLPPAQPAEAQTPTVATLVKNTGQTASSGITFQPSLKYANAFTTGSNATGYRLSSIGVSLNVTGTLTAEHLAALKAEVWSDNGSGLPNAKLWDLTTPSSVTTGVVSFAAPSNTSVAASTTYHVVLVGPNLMELVGATSGNEDSGGAAGWSIADDSSSFIAFLGTWTSTSSLDFRMDVKGYANPAASTFVSNTGQTSGQELHFNNRAYAQAFTTGAQSGGYTLSSIGLKFHAAVSSSNVSILRVELWNDSSGSPGSKLADLTVPSSVPAGVVSFAAPSNTTLSASTTYHVVAYNVGGNNQSAQITRTSSNSEDSGKADGWSIANEGRLASVDQPTSTSSWSRQLSIKLQIQVKGFAKQSGGQAQSDVATLSSLSGTPCTDASTCSGSLTLSPAFDSDTTAYTASVANSVTHLRVTPTVTESNASVKAGLGSSLSSVTSGSASSAIALSVGSNTVNVEVTAQDGTTVKTYAIAVTRRSAVAANSVRIWSVVPKDKAFTVHVERASGVCYANVRWRVKDTDLAMSGLQPGEWAERDDASVSTCFTTASLEVPPGTANLVNGQVYELQALGVIDASDTFTSWSASVEGTPSGSVADAVSLSALTGTTSTDGSDFTAGALGLNPAFGEDSEFYSVSVPAAVTHMKLTPTVKTAGATVTVGRKGATPAAVTSGSASAALPLRPGYDDYEVKVTSGSATATYTLRVARLVVPTVTATASALNGKPAIAFTSSAASLGGRSDYTVAFQVKLAGESWPARDTLVTSGAIEGGGTRFDSGGNPLRYGSLKKNTAYHVRAHYVDGSGTVVQVSLPVEASSTQVAVTTWDVPGTPTSVTASAASATSITVGWTAPTDTGGTGASITGYRVRWRIKDTDTNQAGNQAGSWNDDGGVAASGTSHTATGLSSATAYEVQVRALNGIDPGSSWSTTAEATTQNAPVQSTDATLSALTGTTSTDGSTFSGTLTLDPAFAAATEDYIATVPNNVTHLKVTPTANESNATIEAGKGSSLASVTSAAASAAIALAVGANEINVKVTAQDGTTTKTYTVVVTRATTDGLVSNVGQAKASGGERVNQPLATAFTTGTNAAGYTLTGVDFHVHTATASLTSTHLASLTASVWTSDGTALSDSLDNLGDKLADLTAPSSVTDGLLTFAAPSGTTLAAGTTYYVLIGSSAFTGQPNLFLSAVRGDNEDAGGAAGFSIANAGSYFGPVNFWIAIPASGSLSFRVKGSARAGTTTPSAPTALSADAGDGSLALSWVAPAGTPTGYHVHYTYAPSTGTGMVADSAAATGSDASAAWVAATRGTEMTPPTASQTLSGLDNGRTYRWRVRGVNGNGNGAWAFGTGTPVVAISLSSVITQGEGGRLGERIQTGTEAAISGSITVAPGDTNPASVSADLETGYATTFTAAAGATYTFMPTIDIEDDSVNEEHETLKITLNAGTGYTVGTNPTTVVTITDNDPPAAPSGLSLTAGAQKLAVSYSKPAGPVAGYQLRYKTSTATDQTATTAGDPTTGWVTTTQFNAVSTQITNLTNDIAYNVQVRATDGQTASGNGFGDWSASQTGTPTATPTAGVTVSATSVSVAAGSTTTYTIKLNKAPTADVTVTPTSGDTDKATVTNQAKTFTTTNWSQTQTVTVTGVAAGSSTITHAATSTDTAYQGISIASVTATVTAASQTAPTTLALSTDAASNTVAEDGGNVTVTATLNRAATTAVSVTLTATGTATGTADYSLPSAFTIPVGQTSATGTVSIVDDDVDEADETVILTTSVSGLTVTGVTLTITDDDTAGVSVSQTSRSVEVGATTTYTVVLDSKPTANVTVKATSGTPANATVAPAAGRTFTPANWDTVQSFTITGVKVGSSTIAHAATSTDANYPSNLSIGSVSVSVVASSKTFRIESTKTAGEGANAALTVTLGQAAPTGGLALAVTYDYSGSTATADDTGTTPATLTISQGQTTGTLTIPIASDSLVEGDETFTATISTSVTGWAKVSGQDAATITITDDDDNNAKIGFGASGQTTKRLLTVAENVTGRTLSVPVVISHNPQSDVTVNVTVETGGTATEYASAQNPGDFRIQTKSVTFTPTGSTTQNLSVTITNDTLLEENQTIELRISDSTTGTLGALYSRHAMGRLAKVTITDDERTGAKIAFGTDVSSTSLHRASVDEDVTGGTLNVPVTINRIPESSVTIPITLLTASSNPATEYASAQNLGDFRVVTKSVTFGPTDTLSSGTVSKNLAITINNDSLVEEDQAIRLWIGDNTSSELGRHYARTTGSREARVTIEDDEADEATIAFTIIALPASRAEFGAEEQENVATGKLDVPVTVSAKPESEFTVNVSVVAQGTTATSADYTIGTSSVTFGPDRSVEQAVEISITDDMLVEEDQTIKLRLAAAGSGLDRFYARDTSEASDTDGVSTEATVTINDNERPDAKIAFHATNASSTAAYTADVDEDVSGGAVNVPVVVTALPEKPTTFVVEVLAATTATSADYTIATSSVTFRPGDADRVENLRVRLLNDLLVEHPETVKLRIKAARASTDTEFDLGDHYGRNAQSRLATLNVADDDAEEADIALGTNAASTSVFAVDRREGTGTGAYDLPFAVSRAPSEATVFTLDVLTTGTAAATTDFVSVSDTFTLAAGATSGTFSFLVNDDSWVEHDETILVRITAANASGSTLEKYYDRHADGSRATITISDDEQRKARIAFGTNAASTSRHTAAGEEVVGTLKVPITINWLPESETTFTVEVLSEQDGTTARETADPANGTGNPRDFQIASKQVTFGPATDKKMDLTIAIDNDTVEEDDEHIVLRIVAADTTVDDLGDHYRRHTAGATARVTLESEDEVSKVTLSTSAPSFRGQFYRVFEGTQFTVTATADIPVGPGGWRVTPSRRTGQGFSGPSWASAADVRFEPFTIPEGQTTATGTVRILSDTATEDQEVLLVQGTARRRARSLAAALSGLVQLKGLYVQIFNSGAGATLSTRQLEMVEEEEVEYQISLNTAPTADVVVTPATSSAATATVSGALTFTSTNYSDPQTVTVTGKADGTATISHTVTSTDTNYNSLSIPNVTAKVLEPAKTFTLAAKGTGAATATGVEGTAVELEVTLDALAPTGGLSMTVAHSIGSTTPATLTVAAGERRATLNVAIADDSTPSAAIATHTVTVSATGWAPKRTGADKVVVSFSDDDGGEAFVAFAATGTTTAPANAYAAEVDEDVSAGALNVPVTISALPAEPVTFTVRVLPGSTATEGADFTIAQKTITFAADSSDTATTKNLAITLVDDDLVEADETIRLGFAAARSPARTTGDLYARKPAGNLQAVVTIDSEDAPESFSIEVAGTGVVQGGQGQEGSQLQITATLDKPADTGGVAITLAATAACPGGAGANPATTADYKLPGAFTIPAGDTKATATILLPRDETVDGDRSLRLTATANPTLTLDWVYDTAPCLDITIRDIDSPGLTLSTTSLTITAGQSETYTIRLNTQPAAAVTVAVAVDPAEHATAAPATLAFTTQNWRTPKQIRIQAQTVGTATVTATATSTDPNYNNRTAALTLTVTAPARTPTTPTGGGPTGPPSGGGPSGPPGGGGPSGPPSGGGGGGGGGDGDDSRGEATRLAGADRYATSAAVARQVAELADGKLDTVVLAGGHSWTDALVAGPLAGALDAALLLTAPGGLPDDTVAWLAELGVSDIIAVGGTDTITPDALEALSHLDGDIERITADNPYAASVAVARRVGQPATLGPLLGRTVIVASGKAFPDALSAGPLAAWGPHPILYADEGTLHPQVAAYLAEHADHVIIMGGTAAVTDDIETQIRAIPQANRTGERPMAITRLGGADRYATAVAFARWLNTPALEGRHCFTPDTVGLATGINPADAAASAPLLARRCAPLLLTQPDRLPTITASYLRRTSQLIVFGGTKAINRTALADWDQ